MQKQLLFVLGMLWQVASAQTMPLTTPSSQVTTAMPDSVRMAWFQEAKLGIFVHWGIYSVYGVDESWSFFNGYLPHERYMEQLKGFTANHYDAKAWAKLFKATGAKYVVFTTKHHDGVAMWHTAQGSMSIVKQTPAKQDVFQPLVSALRAEGLKVGAYFSLIDWTHPDYPEFLRNQKKYDLKQAPERWQRFKQYYQAQLQELATQFNPDLWWFDGDWEHSAEEWEAAKVRQMLLSQNPKVILNSRLAGKGDYATPEQGLPIIKPAAPYWELCLTANDSWGYQGTDLNYKTPFEVIRIFADVISMGGNLLLDFGPKEDGRFRKEDLEIMETLGAWTNKHAEAIFGTRAGLPAGHFYGPTTLSKDRQTLYLFLTGKPSQGQLLLKGLKSPIAYIRVLGSGQKLYGFRMKGKPWWSQIPGLITIDIPDSVSFDPYMTVVAVHFSEPLKLHRGE